MKNLFKPEIIQSVQNRTYREELDQYWDMINGGVPYEVLNYHGIELKVPRGDTWWIACDGYDRTAEIWLYRVARDFKDNKYRPHILVDDGCHLRWGYTYETHNGLEDDDVDSFCVGNVRYDNGTVRDCAFTLIGLDVRVTPAETPLSQLAW